MVLTMYIMHNLQLVGITYVRGGVEAEKGQFLPSSKDQQNRPPRLQALFFLYRSINQSVRSLVYKFYLYISLQPWQRI